MPRNGGAIKRPPQGGGKKQQQKWVAKAPAPAPQNGGDGGGIGLLPAPGVLDGGQGGLGRGPQGKAPEEAPGETPGEAPGEAPQQKLSKGQRKRLNKKLKKEQAQQAQEPPKQQEAPKPKTPEELFTEQLMDGAPGLTEGQAAAFLPMRETRPIEDLVAMAVEVVAGTAAERIAGLATAVPALSAADVVTLSTIPPDVRGNDAVVALAKAITQGPPPTAGRTIADAATLAAGVPAATADDIPALLRFSAAWDVPSIAAFAARLAGPGVTGNELRLAAQRLAPVAPAGVDSFASLMVSDGVTAAEFCTLVGNLSAAGLGGQAIVDKVEALRGSADAAAEDITKPDGDRVMTGAMISQQVAAKIGAFRGKKRGNGPTLAERVTDLDRYPTGVDPASRTENQLWEDCQTDVLGTMPDNSPETLAQAKIRQRLALKRLMNLGGGIDKAIVQKVFSYNEGKAPRPVNDPATEDGLDPTGSAHIVDRHVLDGSGTIPTKKELALRTVFNYGASCPGKAGAFASTAGAKTGMQAALNAHIAASPANWVALREKVVRKQAANLDIRPAAATGTCMRINRGPGAGGLYSSQPMAKKALPQGETYPNGAIPGRGGRTLYAGGPAPDPAMAYDDNGGKSMAHLDGPDLFWNEHGGQHIPYEPNVVLATEAPVAGVHLRIIGGDVSGGWFIHSAWPIP